MSLFSQEPTFDFIGRRWYALVFSLVIIAGGIAMLVSRGGLPVGIDFSGGTLLVLEFVQPTSEATVRKSLAAVEEKVIQQYGTSGSGILVRLPQAGPEEGMSLEEGAQAVISTLGTSNLGEFEVVSRDLVGPIISEELQQRGINAFFWAMVGILVYVGLRFRFSFGVGAIVAVVHDILVTVAMLMMFGYELSLNVVAAMLTITGYSVNDSIVVFDRVRENLRRMRSDQFEYLVNKSINQTLARTLITSGTTSFAVLALYLFGGEVLRGFAFTMLVGVISGTYSTIFIAASVTISITKWRAARRRRQTGARASEGVARPPKAQRASHSRQKRQSRKAPRAS